MKKILMSLLLISGLSVGQEIVSVSLEPSLRYEDLFVSCDFAPYHKVFQLTVEFEGGKAVQGRFIKKNAFNEKKIWNLSADELASVEKLSIPQAQTEGIRAFEANQATLLFLFYESSYSDKKCVAQDSILDLYPRSHRFEFPVPEKGEDFETETPLAVFNGLNTQHETFRIEFGLKQRR